MIPSATFAGNVVFEIANDTQAITTFANLQAIGQTNPEAALTVDSSGNLFGTSVRGGSGGTGAVFEIQGATAAVSVLATFAASSGEFPEGGVALDPGGNLFGTTSQGGTGGSGTVFEIPNGSTVSTTLANFTGANGKDPNGDLVSDSAGNIFGTTVSGSPGNAGTVFEIVHGSNTLVNIFNFASHGLSAGIFGEMLIEPNGDLFGAASNGGIANAGDVFELSTRPPNLAFVQPPGDTSAGSVVGGSSGVEVAVNYSWGNTVLTDSSTVTFTLAGGVFSTGSNTATAASVNGVATFNTLVINTPGAYTLMATDGKLSPATSASFNVTAAGPNLLGGPVVNGDNPNGLPTSGTFGAQRSMVEDIVYTFDSPVMIPDANTAFTISSAGEFGGIVPATLFATAVPGSNNTQWAVSLTGAAPGVLGSIANGEYSITLNGAGVFSAADGTTPLSGGAGRTDSYYRLFGAYNGDRVINAVDNLKFKNAINGAYNPIFDVNADGVINAGDNLVFKNDLSIGYAGDAIFDATI